MKDRIEIVALNILSRRERAAFVRFPFRLADAHPYWHPGLRMWQDARIHPRDNPFIKAWQPELIQARNAQGEVLAQAGLVRPGYIRDMPEAAMLILPDLIDHKEAFFLLMEHLRGRAMEHGARRIIGPFNPNIHYDVGVQYRGFEKENAPFMGYQPPYYASLFEDYGFYGMAHFDSWHLDRDQFSVSVPIERAEQKVLQHPGLSFRQVDLRNFSRELRIFHALYSESFRDHWGFSAPDLEEFTFIAGDLRYLLRPPMALIAEYRSRPIGFVLGIPDPLEAIDKRELGRLTPRAIFHLGLHWRKIRRTRVMVAGVLPEYRHTGAHIPLFLQVARNIFDLGYEGGQIAWVMDRNRPMQRLLEGIGAVKCQGYRLYALDL
jgi:hypothetical protein